MDSERLSAGCQDYHDWISVYLASDTLSQRRFSTSSLEHLPTDEYKNLHPQLLGQLFDRILEYLQKDFEELVERLKEQVGQELLAYALMHDLGYAALITLSSFSP